MKRKTRNSLSAARSAAKLARIAQSDCSSKTSGFIQTSPKHLNASPTVTSSPRLRQRRGSGREASLELNSPDFVPSVFPIKQENENCDKKEECAPCSRQRTRCSPRLRLGGPKPKTDESAVDLQPSFLSDAQNELSEEEQKSSSPSVLKGGETLTEDDGTDAENSASRLNGMFPSLPAEITALFKRSPIVRLKRLPMPTGGFQRKLCSETFTSSSLLVQHKVLHEENLSFMCEICGKSFTDQKEFTAHQQNHPELEPYFPCNLCDRSFPSIQQLKRHKLLHVNDARKCPKCGTMFCQRHNHIVPKPNIKLVSEEESEDMTSEESEKVSDDLMEREAAPVEAEPNQVIETPVSAETSQIIRSPPNCRVVTLSVSVVPVRGVFRETPKASPSSPRIEVLPQVSFPAEKLSPLPTSLPLPPPPPPPILKHSSDDIHPAVQPETEEPKPPLPLLKYSGNDVHPAIQQMKEEPNPPTPSLPVLTCSSDDIHPVMQQKTEPNPPTPLPTLKYSSKIYPAIQPKKEEPNPPPPFLPLPIFKLSSDGTSPSIRQKTGEPHPPLPMVKYSVVNIYPSVHPKKAKPVPPPPPPPPPSFSMLQSSIDCTQPLVEQNNKPCPPVKEPPVPKSSDFPPSLKMFSPQYLTSGLLEVKRNYKYIFELPKRCEAIVKKEEDDPVPVSLQSKPSRPPLRRRVAYDLEIVL